jgi:hypothetical protein
MKAYQKTHYTPRNTLIYDDYLYQQGVSFPINEPFPRGQELVFYFNYRSNWTEKASNLSVVAGLSTSLSSTLSNGNYSWQINCSDGLNSGITEKRNISIAIPASYTPFWAKANTHTHTNY